MADLTISVDIDARGTETGARRVQASIAGIGGGLKQAGAALAEFIGNIGAGAFRELISQLGSGVKAVIEYSARLEQLKVAFTSLIGSADGAAQHIKDLKKFALDTPFELEGLAKASQRLQGVGVSAKDVIPLMKDIGNAVSATGEITEDRLSGVTNAIAQMIGKGKLSAEEMEQLAERGIPSWQILSEAIGKTQAETRKLSEQGVLTSDIMLKALRHISQEKWGDAMVKQSHTFSGAMSSIKDFIKNWADTAFKPVFDAISKFADDTAKSLASQEEKAKGAGASFGFAIGEAVGDAYRRGIASNGGLLSSLNDFNPLNPLTGLNLGWGFQKGANGFEDTARLGSFTVQFDAVTGTMKAVQSESKKTATAMKGLGSEITGGAKGAKEMRDIISDLSSDIAFFGQTSQVAATKQKLINNGIYDFTKGAGEQAVRLASTLDSLRSKQEDAKQYTDTLQDLQKQLEQMKADAEFDIRFPNVTELDRFERWVKENTKGFSDLRSQIDATRQSLKDQVFTASVRTRDANQRTVIDDLRRQINEINNLNTDAVSVKLRSIADTVNLKGFKAGREDISQDVFASKVKSYIDNIKLLESLKLPTDEVRKAFENFLVSLKSANGALNIFTNDTEESIPELVELFLRLGGALDKAAADAANLAGKGVLTSLNNDIAELTEQLRTGAEVTETFRIQQELLKDTYVDMDPAIRANILARAAEVDALRASLKAQEESKRAYNELYGTIRESLGVLAEQGFGAFFKSIARRFKNMLLDMAAQWLTSKIFNLFYKGGNTNIQQQNGQSGGIVDSILKKIFGASAAGSGPGGTPNFNPGSGGGNGIFGPGGIFGGGGTPLGNGNVPPTGTINANGEYVVNGNEPGSIWSQIFGPKTNILTGKDSKAGGVLGGIGSIANLIGGLVGGRTGTFLTNIGMGLQLGSMFGPWGAVAGAVIGAVASIFQLNSQRRKDEKTRNAAMVEALSTLRSQYDALISDVRTLRIDPASGIAQGTSIGAQVREQYMQMANGLKDGKTRRIALADVARIDALIAEKMAALRGVAEIAQGASDRDRRLIPEFANGVYMSPQFQAFRRYNGLLGGTWTGRDVVPALIAHKEMVLNPDQQSAVIRSAGRDVFKDANIPGYAGGAYMSAPTQMSMGDVNVMISIDQDADGLWHATAKSSNGRKVIASIVSDAHANDEIKMKRRGA